MGRNMNIKDFFKSYTRPIVAKCPFTDDDTDNAERPRKSRSITPRSSSSPEDEHTNQSGLAGSVQQSSSPRSASSISRDSTQGTKQDKPEQALTGSSGVDERPGEQGLQDQLASRGPSGSQGPLLTSSQRVVRNGEVIIRNSDDDGSDSDSSLGDIDDLLKSRRVPDPATSSPLTEPGSTTPSLAERSLSEETGKAGPRTRAATRKRPTSYQPAVTLPPKYRFDLGNLMERNAKAETIEESISRARQFLESIEQQKASKADRAGSEVLQEKTIDEGLLTSALGGRAESNEVGRLMTAIQRTEALQQEKSWAFFETEEDAVSPEPPPFPAESLDPCPLIFRNTSTRQQAFLGGYVGAMASKGQLPDEIFLWVVDAACTESREDLRSAYGEIVKEAPKQITYLITSERISTLFSKLSAKRTALNTEGPIVPVASVSSDTERGLKRPRFESLLTLIRSMAPSLCVEARSHSISLLCRLLMDHSLNRLPQISIRLEDTLEILVESMPNDTREQELLKISNQLFSSLTDITLRSRLVENLLASSPTLSLFRRRLSLSFFLNDASYLSKDTETLLNLSSVSYQLTKPGHTVSRNTDFANMAASISLLSVGVDNGDPPLARFNRKAEDSFNKAVDMLSFEIKSMNNRIVDAGASHMRRTQAKQVLESFHSRLRYAIRITPPPQRAGVAEMTEEARERQKDFMMKHMKSITETASPI